MFLNLFSTVRRIKSELAWVVTGQFLSLLGMVISVRVLSDLMGPESYGQLTLSLTITTFFGQLLMGPLGNGIERFYSAAKEGGDLEGYRKAVLRLLKRATLCCFGIYVIQVAILEVLNFEHVRLLCALSTALAILSGTNSILLSIQNAARQRKTTALLQAGSTWSRFSLAALFVLFFENNATEALVGYSFAALLILGFQAYYLNGLFERAGPGCFRPNYWGTRIVTFARPYAVWGLFSWTQQASDRWSLEIFSNSEDVGHYVILYQLGFYPITLLSGFIQQLLMPILSQRAGIASDANRIQRAVRINNLIILITFIATILAVSLSYLWSERLFELLLSKRYVHLAEYFPWFILSGGLFALGQLASNIPAIMANSSAILLPKIGSCVLGFLFNVYGGFEYGFEGVVAAVFFYTLLYVLWISLVSISLYRKAVTATK